MVACPTLTFDALVSVIVALFAAASLHRAAFKQDALGVLEGNLKLEVHSANLLLLILEPEIWVKQA